MTLRSDRTRRRSAVLAAGCLLLSYFAVTMTSSTLAAPAQAAAPTSCLGPDSQDPGTKDPVLLVHGWNSTADAWQHETDTNPTTNPHPSAIQNISGLSLSRFVYGDAPTDDKSLSLNWVTDPGIGHDLAAQISCLADLSKANGGIGRVFLVGHSMGGLAIRCALSPACNGLNSSQVQGVRDDVAAVITFGTPNQGSFWRSQTVGNGAEKALSDALTAVCAVASIHATGQIDSLCGYLLELGNGPAAEAFNPASTELANLPSFNGSGLTQVPVREVAGSIQLSTSLGPLWHHWLGSGGDLVVGEASATSQAQVVNGVGGADTESCGSLDLSLLGAAATIGNALAGVSCSHLNETSSDAFWTQAITTITAWRMKHDPTSLALKTASAMPKVSNPVPVPGGFEAAGWDPQGHISFYKWTPTTLAWQKVGSSMYPPWGDPYPAQDFKYSAVTGGTLSGATDATFIMNGSFTGDGSGNHAIFARSSHGYGILRGTAGSANLSIVTGTTSRPTGAIEYDARITKGMLEVWVGNSGFFDEASAGLFALVTRYHRAGDVLTAVSDNAFTGNVIPAPPDSGPSWPLNGSCPTDGTFRASFGVDETALGKGIHGRNDLPLTSLPVLVGPANLTGYTGYMCPYQAGYHTPMAVMLAHKSGAGRITNRIWVTAPAWLLDAYLATIFNDLPPYDLYPGELDVGQSPWVLSDSGDANAIVSYMGSPDSAATAQGLGYEPTPAQGFVEIHNGHVTRFVVSPGA